MENEKVHFSSMQKSILWGMIVAYTSAYICRLNLSAALSSIVTGAGISQEMAGMLPTAFAVTYAAGQFVNGSIVNRVHPVHHMLLGLSGSAVTNLLMGLVGTFFRGSAAFAGFFALCVVNGIFQSMLWTPIVRLIALTFTTDGQRKKINFQLAFTMTVGHFLAWGISYLMVQHVGWTFSFIAPALVIVPVFFLVKHLLRSVKEVGPVEKIAARAMHSSSPRHVLLATGFPLILIGCVLHGFIRDGIINWAPTILASLGGSSMAFSLIIPLINCVGIIAGHLLVSSKSGSPRKTTALLFLCGAVACAILMLSGSVPVLLAFVMGCACACMYGMNPILTTLIPLEYDKYSMSAITAGMVDSFVYIGSAFSGAVGGALFAASQNVLFAALTLASVAAAGVVWAAARKKV